MPSGNSPRDPIPTVATDARPGSGRRSEIARSCDVDARESLQIVIQTRNDEEETIMPERATVVLVHGAFADASGHAGIIRILQSRGIEARAPMNPLRGLAFDADAITRYTTAINGPILLVGHSYGGAVISQAAPVVEDVSGLVFLSAFALEEGESCASVQEGFPPPLSAETVIATHYDAPGAVGGPDLFIGIADFHQTFCADLPDGIAATMAVSQRPVSAAALTEPATAAGWRNLPTWYMVSKEDAAIPPDCERHMAKRMNATTVEVEGSHAAFIAQPEFAAHLILAALGMA
jgi:pimeloyl-ACP methyl ester carboxylesterase